MTRWILSFTLGCLALSLPTSHAAVDKQKNDEALKKGVEFLKKNYTNTAHGIGVPALVGLALLEAEVPVSDPVIIDITKAIRVSALGENNTYNLALCILFLDKLNVPSDVPLIQVLGARLIIGQNNFGGWGYTCTPEIPAAEQARLLGTLRPTSDGSLHPEAARLLQLRGRNPNAMAGDDNSNTQFAIIGVWVAQRRGVPATSTIAAIDTRFLRTQSPTDHGWSYSNSTGGNSSTPAMTCAGLLGLAVGKAAAEAQKAGKKLVGEGNPAPRKKVEDDDPFFNPPAPNAKPQSEEPEEDLPEEDPMPTKKPPSIRDMAIDRALSALGRILGNKPGGPGGAMAASHWGGVNDLYFVWSLERVAVGFGLETIGDVDWYEWGVNMLLPSQRPDGSWQGSHQPAVETSFAVLFLKKANFVADLTRQINGKVQDPGNGELRGSRGGPLAIAAMGRKIDLNTEGPPDPKNPDLNKVRGPSKADRIAEGLLLPQSQTRWEGRLKAAQETPGGEHTAGLAMAIPFLTERRSLMAREALADRLTRMTPKTLERMLDDRDAELRRAACLAIGMKDEKSLTLPLIERVSDIDDSVVRAARASLKAMYNQDFGPTSGANDDRKRIALEEWRSWYTTNGPKP